MDNSMELENKILSGQNVFLIGFMGTGKSTVADYLNKHYGMEVVEMDQLIASEERMTISEIFQTHGEKYFRNLETNLLMRMQSKNNSVISCGGGAPMRENNVKEMKKSGKVVLLTARPETILDRVKNNHDRPLLENNKTVEHIEELMQKRREKYLEAADAVVATDGRSAADICRELLEVLKD